MNPSAITSAERAEAVFLYQNLVGIRLAIMDGATDFFKLKRQAMEVLAARGWQVDYVTIRAQSSLSEPTASECELVVWLRLGLGEPD